MLRAIDTVGEERERIRKTLLELSEYYSVKLTDNQLDMYTDDLIDLGWKQVEHAAKLYRKDWGSVKFPFPSQLRKEVFAM